MAIGFSSQGAGVETVTSGAALSPLCPATVNANDILIGHVCYKDTSTTPSTPGGWTLLYGPADIGTTPSGRHYIFGMIAAGTEDGAAVAFGTQGGTIHRHARVYSFTGWVSGTIDQVARGFSATVHATDPSMPTVVTTLANSLAVACVFQQDNNASDSATGESGGDWVEAVAEYLPALGTGSMQTIQTAAMAAAGTISGGTISTANDPCGVIGFEIRTDLVSIIPGIAMALTVS